MLLGLVATAPRRRVAPAAPVRAVPRQPAPARANPPEKDCAVLRPSRSWRARQFAKNLLDGSFFIPTFARLANAVGLGVMYGELRGQVVHADGSITDYGLLGRRVITTAGVTYLAADMAGGANDINLFKYHGFGSGTTAEASGDTALVTEYTTEYATDNTRPTGSQSSSTNVYTTVGTFSPDATVTCTEHGIFTQAATGGGTLWDRTKFTGIGLTGSSDSLQASYTSTFPAGS